MNTNKPYTVIHASDDIRIPRLNRFTCPTTIVDYTMPFEQLLRDANCSLFDQVVTKDTFSTYRDLGTESRSLELVRFKKSGIRKGQVEAAFLHAYLRPANYFELMAFVASKMDTASKDPIIALGSSNEMYLRDIERHKHWMKKLVERITQRTLVIRPAYPIVEFGHPSNRLRLTESSDDGWKSECLFLAVHKKRANDDKLVPMPLTREAYDKLLSMDSLDLCRGAIKDGSVGTLFRADDGHICKLVRGNDMFQHQWSGMSVPKFGLNHYRPVFDDKD